MTQKQWQQAPEMKIDARKQYMAKIETNKGTIELELYPQYAPRTVNNFVFLAREGYYDGVTFHRVIANFMIQGGDPTGTGRGGPGYNFADEFSGKQKYAMRGGRLPGQFILNGPWQWIRAVTCACDLKRC